MSNARTLLPTARGQLTPAFRQGLADADLGDFVQPFELDRDLRLDDVRRVVDHAMASFDDPVASDAWLAPRLHAVLRLRRSEAAERGLWAWLSTVEFPDYSRWRFPGKGADEEEDETKRGTPLKRFVGSGRDNTLARLWWGAELFRDGDDYEPVVRAFAKQDVPNTWLSLDAVHHPAAAQASLKLLPALGSKPINRLSTALDHVLTTVQLDVLAPIEAPDTIAADEWVAMSANIEDILDGDLPRGPEESPVPKELVDDVEALIRRVATEIQLPLPAP
jgi:Family of unknown function (DUF6339)